MTTTAIDIVISSIQEGYNSSKEIISEWEKENIIIKYGEVLEKFSELELYNIGYCVGYCLYHNEYSNVMKELSYDCCFIIMDMIDSIMYMEW